MTIISGDKSDILFKRLFLLSILIYFTLVLAIEFIPFTAEVKSRAVKPQRTVKLMPLKGPAPSAISVKKEIEQRLAKEQKRAQEEARRLAEKQKRQELERQKAEERKRIEEERRRIDEERRIEEEKRRAEEEKRLAKERNREAAMSSGLLKAMKGEKKAAEKIVSNEEINSALSAPSGKLITTQQVKAETEGNQKYAPPQKKALKGSEGIGDVSASLPKRQTGSLSDKKSKVDIRRGGIEGDGVRPPLGSGTLKDRSQESIKEVVASHRGSIDFIYKKALRDNPTLKGTIVIELTVAENGEVVSGHVVSSTIKDPPFENQVLKRILTWKFPPYPDSGNTVVSFPIEFSPV